MRNNNFDLIRLLAAFQVLIGHTIEHLAINNSHMAFLTKFPGVIIFFTISGFLIYASYERSKNFKEYIIKRCLRIFPGLWGCVLLTICLLFAFGQINFRDFTNSSFIAYLIGQFSLFQFYTPELLRGWGCGTPNGSLWTITVEFQFYLILPLIFWCFSSFNRKIKSIGIILILLGSVFFNFYYSTFAEELLFIKLAKVSVVPYLYCFLFGVLMQMYWTEIKAYVEGNFLIFLGIYLAFCYFFETGPSYHLVDAYQLISVILLSFVTISGAFSLTSLGKVLRSNDISYGIYIYHMLVVNSFIALGWVNRIEYLWLVILITVLLSILSWIFIEKKALLLKNQIAIGLKKQINKEC